MEPRLQHEIEHGRYLAKHRAGEIWNWESPAGRIRWQRRVHMLSADIREGMRVLELGCGTGYFTRELARTGAMIDAVDISPELLAAAREHCPTANVTFQIQNAYALEYEDSVFDAVPSGSSGPSPPCDRASPDPDSSRSATARHNLLYRAKYVKPANRHSEKRAGGETTVGRLPG